MPKKGEENTIFDTFETKPMSLKFLKLILNSSININEYFNDYFKFQWNNGAF